MAGIPDLVAVDWQARLLGKLTKWGYQVLHKPHPGGTARPPIGFVEKFGVRMLGGRFEDVMSRADLYLFDFALTSTFGPALSSAKPMVLIDFGMAPWIEEARKMLERRCAIVRGWFDEANRAHVHWDELRDAIEESRNLMDMSLVNTYFGYG